ncbi:MAG: glycosyltransferase [Chryseolinea sp.]
MSRRVLFLCYHGIGHINPCFPLARILENEGHQVTIATVEHFGRHVARAGFSHRSLKTVPFGLGFESWMNTQRKRRFQYWANLSDRIFDRLYTERERELITVLDTIEPDLVFIDATQATDFIVLYPLLQKRRIAYAMLHAMFPTHVLRGRPPVDSMLIPGDPKEEASALNRMNSKLDWTDLKQRLRYFGMSDRYIINRRLKRNQIPNTYRQTLPSLFDFQVSNVPSLIFAPRQFDYPHFENPTNFHYLGFIYADIVPTPREEWAKVRPLIHNSRTAGSKLIYCSFGTVALGREEQTDAFLLRLADVVTGQGNQLMVSIGLQRTAPSGLMRKNVWVFPSVPQMEVLRDSDVFVTHGGLSSIKEAIEALVPMLMIVVHNQYDPPGNAARVQYHGMGIVGDVDSDAEVIEAQLNDLITNDQYRSNLKKLRDEDNPGGDQRFLQLFNTILQTPQ